MAAPSRLIELFDPSADTDIRKGNQLWTRLADRLRQEIFTGQRSPGERLVETRIASEIGVAQSSVREALHQLEKEGLVVRLPGVGARVSQLSAEQVEQIYGLRAELEGYAVELVGRKGDSSDIAALAARVARCLEAADGAPLSFMMADLEFHLELWSRSSNPFLFETVSRLVIPLFAFETRAVVPLLSRDERLRNVETHSRVVELLGAGEVARARRSMAEAMDVFRQQTRGLSREAGR